VEKIRGITEKAAVKKTDGARTWPAVRRDPRGKRSEVTALPGHL